MTEQQDKHPKRCEELYYHMSKKEALLIQNFLYSHQVIDLPGWKDAENAYQSILSRMIQHSSSGSPCVTERQKTMIGTPEIRRLLKSLQDDICCDDVCTYSSPDCDIECPHEIALVQMHDRAIEQAAREDERKKWYSEQIRDLEELISLSDKLLHQFPDDFSLKFSKEQASRELKRLESLRSATPEPAKENKP